MTTTFEQLQSEVRAAWIGACEADGIDPDSKFVVFHNTVEAAAYNELMGVYLRARKYLSLTNMTPKVAVQLARSAVRQ